MEVELPDLIQYGRVILKSKSESHRFGSENVRIQSDFQVAKKRTFLITKTIDFDRFLIQI